MNKLANKLFRRFFYFKRNKVRQAYNRVLPVNEMLTDRWEKARYLGFGKGASVYDSAFIFGNVQVGQNTWVGPFAILDGSGGLTIGSNCSVSAGVHIYTHNTVAWAVSGGKAKYVYAPVSIGDNCFIGPQSIIQNGVTIGKYCIVAANSFVNTNVPDWSIVAGNPAKVIGIVEVSENGEVKMEYNK